MDVWLESILILDRVAGGHALVAVTLQRRIDVLLEPEVLIESITVHLANPEKIVAVRGSATSGLSRPIAIEYETTEGALKHLR